MSFIVYYLFLAVMKYTVVNLNIIVDSKAHGLNLKRREGFLSLMSKVP